MHEVFVYGPTCTDFSSNGLCGDLKPVECIFEQEKNSLSQITMQLAYDDLDKWRSIEVGGYLKCKVPVRTPPAISGDEYAATLKSYRATVGRTTYSDAADDPAPAAEVVKKTVPLHGDLAGKVAIAYLDDGDIVNEIADDGKVQTSKGTGYVSNKTYIDTVSIPKALNGVESVAGATRLAYQIFHITEVVEDLEWIHVTATHISYDLLNCYTNYVTEHSVTGAAACAGIVNNEMVKDERFTIVSDCSDPIEGGLDYAGKNVIKALLDPDNGVCARYGLVLIRDNFALYAIKQAGTDRGFAVEYGKNMLDMEHTLNIEECYTRIIPVGKDSKGKPKYLSGTIYIDSEHIGDYANPRTYLLDCSETCTIGKNGCDSRNFETRMRQAVQDAFDDGCDKPSLSMTVDFLSLGDTEEYAQYRDLDKVFLYDRITVRDTFRNHSYNAEVVSIRHNVLTGRLESCTIDSIEKSTVARKIASWQVPIFSGTQIQSGTIPVGAFTEGAITADDVSEDFGQEVDLSNNDVAKKLDGRESYLSVTKDKVEIFGGEVNIHGAGALSLECDNDQMATVNGGAIWHAKNLVVSTEEPDNKRPGMLWVRPDMTGVLTSDWTGKALSERPNAYNVTIPVKGTPITQVPTSGATYSYTVAVPIYNYDAYNHGNVRVWLVPNESIDPAEGVAFGRKTISGEGSKWYTATVNSSLWLGDRSDLVLVIHTDDRDMTRVNSGNTFKLTCTASGAGDSTGWKDCTVYYWHQRATVIYADLRLYIRSAEQPSAPAAARYNLEESRWVDGLEGWSQTQPTGSDTLWFIDTSISGTYIYTIGQGEWSEPEAETTVELIRTYAANKTTYTYGTDPNRVITRNNNITVATFSGDAAGAEGGTFYYTIQVPFYWQAGSYSITSLTVTLQATINGVTRSVTFPAMTKAAGRAAFWYSQSTQSSVWLGEASSISMIVRYSSSNDGSYLYSWYGAVMSNYGTGTLVMRNYQEGRNESSGHLVKTDPGNVY